VPAAVLGDQVVRLTEPINKGNTKRTGATTPPNLASNRIRHARIMFSGTAEDSCGGRII